MIDFTPSLEQKGFYRFTGPPENWLTAIKFKTWGLERKFEARWKQIQPGDVFFIHSTGPGSSMFPNAAAGVIGLGVVGEHFTIKDNYLWLQEFRDTVNRWPLLVPFSEIYLFSEIPNPSLWEAPSEGNKSATQRLVSQLLRNVMPIKELDGFPVMGSFSGVRLEVARKILFDKRKLYEYRDETDYAGAEIKRTPLAEVKSASETLRFADTLKVFENVRSRVVNSVPSEYFRNNELLARAELVHSSILEQLIQLFRGRGYQTLSNQFVDLFAHNEERAFLFEVKSTENRNFKSQFRKGIVQLLEYDYFEVRKFVQDQALKFKDKYSILVPSKQPEDAGYVEFMNHLDIGVAMVEKEGLQAVGKDFGFSKI